MYIHRQSDWRWFKLKRSKGWETSDRTAHGWWSMMATMMVEIVVRDKQIDTILTISRSKVSRPYRMNLDRVRRVRREPYHNPHKPTWDDPDVGVIANRPIRSTSTSPNVYGIGYLGSRPIERRSSNKSHQPMRRVMDRNALDEVLGKTHERWVASMGTAYSILPAELPVGSIFLPSHTFHFDSCSLSLVSFRDNTSIQFASYPLH